MAAQFFSPDGPTDDLWSRLCDFLGSRYNGFNVANMEFFSGEDSCWTWNLKIDGKNVDIHLMPDGRVMEDDETVGNV